MIKITIILFLSIMDAVCSLYLINNCGFYELNVIIRWILNFRNGEVIFIYIKSLIPLILYNIYYVDYRPNKNYATFFNNGLNWLLCVYLSINFYHLYNIFYLTKQW